MTKRYERASPEAWTIARDIRAKHYSEIEAVTVDLLFISDDKTSEPCLSHGGYSAAAVTKVMPGLARGAGMADVLIVIDRAVWQELSHKQKAALLDHELHHIEPVLDAVGEQAFDAQDRPKVRLRKHDWQFGWFDEVANRHGPDSFEVRQAQQVSEASGQLYFDWPAKLGGRGKSEAA